MTDRQEIRVKSTELAIRLMGLAGPFKPMPKSMKEEELNELFNGIRLFTDRIENIILEPPK